MSLWSPEEHWVAFVFFRSVVEHILDPKACRGFPTGRLAFPQCLGLAMAEPQWGWACFFRLGSSGGPHKDERHGQMASFDS